jgi:hypothetical protein
MTEIHDASAYLTVMGIFAFNLLFYILIITLIYTSMTNDSFYEILTGNDFDTCLTYTLYNSRRCI